MIVTWAEIFRIVLQAAHNNGVTSARASIPAPWRADVYFGCTQKQLARVRGEIWYKIPLPLDLAVHLENE